MCGSSVHYPVLSLFDTMNVDQILTNFNPGNSQADFLWLEKPVFFAPAESDKVFHACLLKDTYDVHTEKNLVF